MELQNTHSEYRVWTGLQTTEGRTLALDPGEVGDVAVSKAPNDPWLKPVGAPSRQKGSGKGKPQGRAAHARSGPQDVSGSVTETSGGDSPPDEPTNEPAEADASGKEA
jgi:hypothetical protein